MKKSSIIVVIFIAVVVSSILAGVGYIQYKKSTVEESVLNYLQNDEHIEKNDIASSTPFIANLEGDKNWMVAIKLKDDERTFYYYKSEDKVVLESFVLDGFEYGPDEDVEQIQAEYKKEMEELSKEVEAMYKEGKE